jgi:hypothetical protein
VESEGEPGGSPIESNKYTRPIERWMRECKQNSIFYLIN